MFKKIEVPWGMESVYRALITSRAGPIGRGLSLLATLEGRVRPAFIYIAVDGLDLMTGVLLFGGVSGLCDRATVAPFKFHWKRLKHT